MGWVQLKVFFSSLVPNFSLNTLISLNFLDKCFKMHSGLFSELMSEMLEINGFNLSAVILKTKIFSGFVQFLYLV